MCKKSSGIICGGGCLGILIPPSIVLIVYSVIAQLSPLRLFAAAIFPGLMLQACILPTQFSKCFNPSIAPRPPRGYSTKGRNFKRSDGFLFHYLVYNVSSWNDISGDYTPAEAAAARHLEILLS